MRDLMRLLAVVVLVVTANVAVPDEGRAAKGGWPPAWFGYDRAAQYSSIKTPVRVPMRDGAYLSCDRYLPGRDGAPARGRFPGLVLDYMPYGFRPVAQGHAEYWASHGYAALVCDIRGTGLPGSSSPGNDYDGDWTKVFPQQRRDNYDLVEWVARQRWSTGRIGQIGHSYGAGMTLDVATARPPHLRAVVAEEGVGNLYSWGWYPGGIPSLAENGWAALPRSNRPTFPVEQLRQFRDHPLEDEFWDAANIQSRLPRVRIPVLLYGGWYDVFRQGMPRDFQILRDTPGASPYLIMGPWTHQYADQQASEPVSRGLNLAFMDRLLMKRRAAPLPSAPVTSYEVPQAGSGGWHEFADWPPRRADRVRLHLNGAGALDRAAGRPGSAAYPVNPFDGPSTSCFAGCQPSDEVDQRLPEQARLTFTGRPVKSDVVVAGPGRVRLRAALSATDTNFVVKLMDVAPDGAAHEVSQGYLKATHRESHRYLTQVIPGKTYDYTVELSSAHWRLVRGHRLRISVTAGDMPRIAPDAPAGTVSIATGRGGSFADLWLVS